MEHVIGEEQAMLSLWAALEAKHVHLRGHGLRVGELSMRLARELGADEPFVGWFRAAGALHDVGKIVIPDGVLDKPGPLTPEERVHVRKHPTVGWELCRRLPVAQPILDTILHHHERYDGSGYPGGLVGRKIPYSARILALADVFDAITSERAYRPAMATPVAMELLRGEHAAGKWDPRVFAALEVVVAGEPLPR
jgi:putative nucleotidyltransferase with HDIG domain